MDSLFPSGNPLEQVHVALDLETTGLDAQRDTIIEVGAVKFMGDQVLDTFQTFVNPGRAIPEFIQRLTGITPNQVRRAPQFSAVIDDLENFVETHPIVGHNISFDLSFLASHGLRLGNPSYDTWDLASVFLPRQMEYSLVRLANLFQISHRDAHRALSDARATQSLFVALLRQASMLDGPLLAYMSRVASRSRWAIAPLLRGLELQNQGRSAATLSLTGLDLESLEQRLARPERRRANARLENLDEARIPELLGKNGPLAKTIRGFEQRAEQAQMLGAMTQAIFQGKHLVVEGGTGVGKSMAYLLPALLFAVSKGQRVVVSTNTINLQEQLLNKDIPNLIEALEGGGVLPPGAARAALLKGRSNYLCLKRWQFLTRSENLSPDEARLLSKTAMWLRDTASGDRGEINLSGRDAYTWNRVSAGEKGWCPALRDGSPCFLRAARERAEQAHIVVVNHALLLSDLAHGGGIIPDYQHLIIDEAHNLEDEATRQFGFQVAPERLDEPLEQQGKLLARLRLGLRDASLAFPMRQTGEQAADDLDATGAHLRQLWGDFWSAALRFMETQRAENDDGQAQLLLTPALRRQGHWRDLTLAWENVDVTLSQVDQSLGRLQRFLESAKLPEAEDVATLAAEASNLKDELGGLRQQLAAILGAPDDQAIHWLARDPNRNEIKLNSAPLSVAPILAEQLFKKKDCVALTSATLSAQGSFDYFRRRVGLADDVPQMLVGSPFDYRKAMLLLIPEDMPPPNDAKYIESVGRALTELARSLEGRTMALFTSYAALRSVAQQIRSRLMLDNVEALAQGIDGSPPQLIRRFIENPRSVLLGTSSFWEGVDIPGGILKALVITRLPFQVPTDPVVKARADQHADPFNEYSVPQAALRFRQGIGRLIRNKGDKGTLVALDKRIIGRGYGQAFMQAVPPCSMQPCNLNTVGALAAQWVGGGRGTGR